MSGYRDLLNKHQEVKAAITRLLAQSKAKVSSLMAFGVEGPSGPRRGGGQLVEVPDPAACGGDCSHSGQLCPPAEGLRHSKKTEDWRIENPQRGGKGVAFTPRGGQ